MPRSLWPEPNTPLIKAVKANDAAQVKALLAAGADIHEEDDEALVVAVRQGYPAIVRLLLDHGANIHAQNDDILFIAVARAKPPNSPLRMNAEPALTPADLDRYAAVVTILIAAGVDVRAKNDNAWCTAACHGNPHIVEILTAHIFRPQAWRGRTLEEMLAEVDKLAETVKYRGLHSTEDNKARAVAFAADYAVLAFHNRRRAALAPLKARRPVPPQSL